MRVYLEIRESGQKLPDETVKSSDRDCKVEDVVVFHYKPLVHE